MALLKKCLLLCFVVLFLSFWTTGAVCSCLVVQCEMAWVVPLAHSPDITAYHVVIYTHIPVKHVDMPSLVFSLFVKYIKTLLCSQSDVVNNSNWFSILLFLSRAATFSFCTLMVFSHQNYKVVTGLCRRSPVSATLTRQIHIIAQTSWLHEENTQSIVTWNKGQM